MKTVTSIISLLSVSALAIGILLAAGCASSGSKDGVARQVSKYKATDGRTIDIGKATPSDGGRSFKNPHLEKCWIADGFAFSGYDTLLIAPTASTAKIQDDEQERLRLAKDMIPSKLVYFLTPKGIFTNIVTKESDVTPGARVLKLENSITEYSKGSRAARYFVGLYGGGQPVLRVEGKLSEGDKTLFAYEGRRSGTSAGSRVAGVFIGGDEIQTEDVHSLMLDLTDFMAAIAGKYAPKD
jgi:hypothetical protein